MGWSTLLLSLLLAPQVITGAKAPLEASDLKLVITVEQPAIAAPFPARVTLHLHNSGKETLWLYRRAAQARATRQTEAQPLQTTFGATAPSTGGSTVAIRLEAADSRATLQSVGELFDNVGLPHPKLFRLAAGEDYEEKPVVRLAPAVTDSNGEKKPIWGRYKFAVTYAAKYSNAEELDRILGVTLWQGQVESNSIELELQPPAAAAQGSIAGTVVGSDNVPRSDVLVSLSDREERLLDQASTDTEGRFSFTHLPFGMYWVTVRHKNISEDTAVFRHIVLSPSEPAGTIDFLLTVPETYQPKQLLHKPVLFRVADTAGTPVGNAGLEITWSSGTVLDSVKGRTSDDGIAAVELLPGRNYVTLKRKGCPNDEERLDVSAGSGIDGFKMVSQCSRR